MRTTLDIPDTKYSRLKTKAAHERTSIRQIVLRCIDKELDGEVPRKVNRLTAPGSIRLNNEQIYDLIGFP